MMMRFNPHCESTRSITSFDDSGTTSLEENLSKNKCPIVHLTQDGHHDFDLLNSFFPLSDPSDYVLDTYWNLRYTKGFNCDARK